MNPETKQALKTFWKYAFRSYRVSSRTEFLIALKWHIIPFLLLFSMSSTIETQLGLRELAPGNTFLSYLFYLLYGILLIPYASLPISRLRTMGRSLAWSFLLFIPGFGYLLVAPICLNDN